MSSRPCSLSDEVDSDRIARAELVVAVLVRAGPVRLVDEHGDAKVVVLAPARAQREVVPVALVRQDRVRRVPALGGRADLVYR